MTKRFRIIKLENGTFGVNRIRLFRQPQLIFIGQTLFDACIWVAKNYKYFDVKYYENHVN